MVNGFGITERERERLRIDTERDRERMRESEKQGVSVCVSEVCERECVYERVREMERVTASW